MKDKDIATFSSGGDLDEQVGIIGEYMLEYIDGVECWHSRSDVKTKTYYVDFAKKGNAVVAQQTLKTVVGGRLYTVRLDVYAPQFSRFEQAAYAVVASMKFSGTTTSTPPTEVKEPTATDEMEEETPSTEAEGEASSAEGEQDPAVEAKESD